MRQLTPAPARHRGFTLIEIAMVMVVIGLILSGGLLAMGPVLTSTRISSTQQSMDKIEEALRLYAIRYGCLPCPADGDIATGGTDFGAAQASAGSAYVSGCAIAAATACRADAVGDSVVPWVTLGLTEADTTDGWGNRINYYLSTASAVHQANAVSQPCPPLADGVDYSTDYSNASICRGTSTYPNADLVVRNTNGAILTNSTANNAALYVLVSHGQDRRGARAADSGAATADPEAGSNQATNSAGSAGPFVQDVIIEIEADYFDDIVRWRSAPAFIQSCGAGACGN